MRAAHERPAIGDGYDDRAPIFVIGDVDPRSKRQRTTDCGQCVRVQFDTACGTGSAVCGIDRSDATLGIGEGHLNHSTTDGRKHGAADRLATGYLCQRHLSELAPSAHHME
jgi:hypothetical protein